MLQLFFVAGVALAPPPIQRVEDLRYVKATGVWELHADAPAAASTLVGDRRDRASDAAASTAIPKYQSSHGAPPH